MLLFLYVVIQEKEQLMIETYFSRTSTIDRLRSGPLGPDLDALTSALQRQGYARDSIRHYLHGCDQFARWLVQHGHAVTEVTPTLVQRYVSGLKRPPSGAFPKAAEGLSHLLTHWHHHDRLPDWHHATPETEADQWLQHYAQYLEQVCGTAASTRRHYVRMARRFLAACFGTCPVDWHALQAHQVADFVRHEAATKHGGGRKLPSTTVRSVLRFLVFSGERPPGLEAAALTPRQWTHATLPPRLTPEEAERALALYTDETPVALRNRAILMVLSRLGLRAHEVTALCLEDVNWHEARVIIRSSKSRHERVLPLAHDVGMTLADYLRRGRPATTSRVVFVHCRAPFHPFADAAAISRIAARAFVRAGVTGYTRLGAHVFRHTAASTMINRGASFKDVADVLGHQSLQTTGIYAKLDLPALAEVALPWIGEAR
jgi:site-specific recombinase XerD